MKLWQLNAKLRKFSDRTGWPLITRKRFNLMKENLESEIGYHERIGNEFRMHISAARRQLEAQSGVLKNLTEQLEKAQKQEGLGIE